MKARPSTSTTQRRPIRLRQEIAPTHDHCGIVYDVTLSGDEAAAVRAAARALHIRPAGFSRRLLMGLLPRPSCERPRDDAAAEARAAKVRVTCDDSLYRARLERAAKFNGFANVEDYLLREIGRAVALEELEMVIEPASGRLLLDSAQMQRLRVRTDADARRYVADPLGHPGFLDRFPARNPLLHRGPFIVLDDPRLEPDKAQLVAAA